MKALKPQDPVFYSKIKGFARVLELEEDQVRITYTTDIWGNPKSVVETVSREELKLFGNTTPTKKRKAKTKATKGTKRTAKAKTKVSNTKLDSILDLLD